MGTRLAKSVWILCITCCACSADEVESFGDSSETSVDPGDVLDERPTGSDTTSDVASDAEGVRCAPGVVTCERGVVAQCNAFGDGWEYTACPAGDVCVGHGCVLNRPRIILAVDSPLPDDQSGGPAALPDALVRDIGDLICRDMSACCDEFEAAESIGGNLITSLATKYWVRRLASDLSETTFSWSLLGSPSATPGHATAPECAGALVDQADSCLGGSSSLMTLPELQLLLANLVPAGIEAAAAGIPAWDNDGSTTPSFQKLMAAIVKVGGGTARDVLRWVDGVAETNGGRVSNPELNTTRARDYGMPFLTYLYLAGERNAGSLRCTAASDCGDPDFECVDGLCTDAASACRVEDVIFIASFATVDQEHWTENDCLGGAGYSVAYNVWTQWLRWGVSCEKGGGGCRDGSTCVWPCDYTDFVPCTVSPVCLPDSLATSTGDPLASRVLWGDFLGFFGKRFPADRFGHQLQVTSHTILVGASPVDEQRQGYGAVEEASAGALAGDGVAVTPCAPNVEDDYPAPQSSYFSCDYEAHYQDLLARIRHHAQSSVCTPQLVGLVPQPY